MSPKETQKKASASASDSGKGGEFIAGKLERLGQDMLAQIDADSSPTFTTALRSKGNIIYDNGVGFIRLGDKTEERTFINVGQARKFMQTVAIASKCKKFLKEDAHTSIRGLYYQLKFSLGDTLDEELFSEQSESNPLVEDLEVALSVKREDLNLNTDRKGVVAGPMVLKDKFGGDELYYDVKLENPTIFFVVDRVELETQLHDEISALDMPVAETIASVAHLRSILKHDGGKGRRGLFVVLMHKFKAGEFETLKKELDGREGESILTRRNIVAFIDEGHRTQYGLYAAQMKDLLRNAFFFAFTGTPISMKEKDTYQNFSYPPKEMYLDKYFITESLQDGYTVKIVYQPRLEKEVHLDKKTLDTFLEIESDEIPGEEREGLEEEVKSKMNIIPLVFENPAFIAKIAADVAAHYKENVDGKFKAMVVAGSRKACVLYKRELDKHLPKEYSEVVMTSTGKWEKHQELREYAAEMEKRYGFADIGDINAENKRKFKEEEYPKVLIVTDMLLTGFDVPFLQVMYLHKPLKGHRLLQAIARTNRPYRGVKEAGIILDYVGILKDIKKALSAYSKDVDFKEPAESIEAQRAEFNGLVDETLTIFSGIPRNKYDRATMDNAIRLLTTVRGSSESFIEKYKSLRSLFELLGSDVSKIKRFEDYCWLSAIYAYYTKAVLLEEPETEQYLEKFYAKTLKLVYKTTQVQNLMNDLPIIKFDKDYLEALEKKMETKQEKAANIVFTLNRLVLVERQANPVSESLSGKVARILKLWQDKAANFEAIYREGAQVIAEFNELNRRKDELGFSNLQYSLLLALEEKFDKQDKALVDDVKELSKRLEDIMFPGWNFQQSAKKSVDREVRLFLRKYIRQYGLNLADLEELHQKMMQQVVSYAKG